MESTSEYVLGGVPLRVFGLAQLGQTAREAACIILLHGRKSDHLQMLDTAQRAAERSAAKSTQSSLPLLTVILDGRNHGERSIDPERNESLYEGATNTIRNASHALDLAALVAGNAQDVSMIIDFLPSALFPRGEHSIVRWGVGGFSLGGHSAWWAASRDVRIGHVASLCGTPSLATLLALRRAPVPLTLATLLTHCDADRLPPILWEGRSILVISTEQDDIVPFGPSGTAAFVDKLREADVAVQVHMEPAAGHSYTPALRDTLLTWVQNSLCTAEG